MSALPIAPRPEPAGHTAFGGVRFDATPAVTARGTQTQIGWEDSTPPAHRMPGAASVRNDGPDPTSFGSREAYIEAVEKFNSRVSAVPVKPQSFAAAFDGTFDDIVKRKMPEGHKPSNPKDIMGSTKAPMSTVSALVLAEVGVAMLEGALKYGRHNYRAVGVLASVYYDAATRHLRSWWEGEDIDKASNLSHITKAITSLIVLRDAMIMDKFTDDRPPAHPEIAKFMADLDDMAKSLVERDGHLKPLHYTNSNKNG